MLDSMITKEVNETMTQKKPSGYQEIIQRTARPGERFTIMSEDPLVVKYRINMPYRYFAGPIATRFFTELRDNKKILGIRCPECEITYVPPKATCEKCFGQLKDWVEVKNVGSVLTYTITHYPLKIHPFEEPLIYAVVQLEGSSTGLLHMIGETDPSRITIGMQVEAVFKPKNERSGSILDIDYFRPITKS